MLNIGPNNQCVIFSPQSVHGSVDVGDKIVKKNDDINNNVMNVNKPGSDGRPRSSVCSRLTSRISPWCTTLVWSTHGLISAFFHVGRQFGMSRLNTLAYGLRKRPWSFLMGVSIVTPNRR